MSHLQRRFQSDHAQRQLCRRWRKRIETVASHLTERFRLTHTRTHDLWHYFHRLVRYVLALLSAFFSTSYWVVRRSTWMTSLAAKNPHIR